MNQKEFEDLINRLELYSREKPAAYALRVALWAALGYLFLFMVLATVGGLAYLVMYMRGRYLQFLLVALGLVTIILRALWIKFPEPEGKAMRQADAPKLFALVDEVRRATNGPHVHKLLLTGDLNAAIVQLPRLGIFGWQQNYLLIG